MLARKEVNVYFGALMPSISSQLKEQKLPVPKNIEILQACADAETLLRVQGLLTDSQATIVRKKLVKKIARNVHV